MSAKLHDLTGQNSHQVTLALKRRAPQRITVATSPEPSPLLKCLPRLTDNFKAKVKKLLQRLDYGDASLEHDEPVRVGTSVRTCPCCDRMTWATGPCWCCGFESSKEKEGHA